MLAWLACILDESCWRLTLLVPAEDMEVRLVSDTDVLAASSPIDVDVICLFLSLFLSSSLLVVLSVIVEWY